MDFPIHRRSISKWLAIMLIVVASVRIVSTYSHLSQIYDEPFHMLRGMHWQSGHAYVHSEHPPLGPLVFAILPCWSGLGYSDTGDKLTDGNSILYGNGGYLRTLILFRLGNLIFFWVACIALYAWLASSGRPWHGFLAVAFFTLCPPVLAHSGLATTDLPITAMLLSSVVFVERAICTPFWERWLIAGFACGLALVTKFSALLFLPVCVMILFCIVPKGNHPSMSRRNVVVNALVFLLASFVVVWSIYGFTVAPLNSVRVKEYPFEGFPIWLEKTKVPAPEYVAGVIWAKGKLDAGHGDYFFGNVAPGGSLLFFPTVLAIKTPLAMLLFCLVGGVAAIMKMRRSGSDMPMVPLFMSVALLLSVIPSSVNIGLRHLLPIYPFMSALSAEGLVSLFGCVRSYRFRGALTAIGVVILISWLIVDSCRSHPYYLSHFNELALGRPERIVLDSDLDWGQGVFELEQACQELRIDRLQIHYFGTANLLEHSFPIEPSNEDDTFWVAISQTILYRNPRFEKFRAKTPDATVGGGSILLYRVKRQSTH